MKFGRKHRRGQERVSMVSVIPRPKGAGPQLLEFFWDPYLRQNGLT